MTTIPTGAAGKAGNKLMMTAAGKAGGIASVLAALWLMRQSYEGAKDIWVHDYQKFEDETHMDLWADRHATYSGQPAMDESADSLKELLAYGIAGTRLAYIRGKTYVEGFVNDVILPNLIPLGIASGGVYLALGEKGRTAIVERLKNAKFPVLGVFGGLLVKGAKGLLKGTGRLLNGFSRFTTKNPLASLALMTVGLFGAHRFSRVYHGQEQNEFFRDFTNP